MRTVLIAEAESEARIAYLGHFTRNDFRVKTASDGLECIEKLLPDRPDLLVLSMELPWGGGDGVLGIMREDLRMISIPVVLTSSVIPEKQLQSLVQAPIVKALAKPFPLSHLLEGYSLAASMMMDRISQRYHERGTLIVDDVLVVDDEPTIRNLLREHLQQQGYRVWTARDGEEALDICSEHGDDIGVVLLDVRMPNLDGPQTLIGIREFNTDLPVIFMTGDPGDYDHEGLLAYGAQYVITKPFRLDEITRLVRKYSHETHGALLRA